MIVAIMSNLDIDVGTEVVSESSLPVGLLVAAESLGAAVVTKTGILICTIGGVVGGWLV